MNRKLFIKPIILLIFFTIFMFFIAALAPTISTVILNSSNILKNDTSLNLTVYITTTDVVGINKNITTWTINSNPYAVVMMPYLFQQHLL